MRIVYEYSHLGGKQILQVDHPEILKDIHAVIAGIRKVEKVKKSQEKTKMGKMLFSPRDLNQRFKKGFSARGYRELKDTYTMEFPDYDVKITGCYKQVDFAKDKILIEVQLGKYFAMFYDLAKFQYFFNECHADVGVEIVPCHHLYTQMSSGVSYGEKLVFDVERLRRHFPSVPIYVILIDVNAADYQAAGLRAEEKGVVED